MLSLGRKYDVTSAMLKWVALITMLIDHVGAVILEWMLLYHSFKDTAMWDVVYRIDRVMRGIGRASFPLIIVLLVEGFFYTYDRIRYLIRMLVFLIISEVPFDMALSAMVKDRHQAYLSFAYQNVLFTLVIGFGAMLIMEYIYTTPMLQYKKAALMVLTALIALAGAYVLRTDYNAWGVLAILAAYFAKKRGTSPFWIGLSAIVILTMMNGSEAWAAVIDLPLLLCYHGTKGRRGSKWFYYIFYPAHLILLYLIRVAVFGSGG